MRQYLTAQKAAEEIARGAHVYADLKLFPAAERPAFRLSEFSETFRLSEFSERRILKLLQSDPDKDDAETFFTLDFDGDLILHQPEN
jgi:hypothetical protein